MFAAIAMSALDGTIAIGSVVTYASAAIMSSTIAFGGFSWALDGAAAPVAAVLRLEGTMQEAGALQSASGATNEATLTPALSRGERAKFGRAALGMPARDISFRNVTFAYPDTNENVLEGFDLTIPAGSSLAIVGQNGAGKTTLAKLLCRLYDPQAGSILIDGVDLRDLDLDCMAGRPGGGLSGFHSIRAAIT